jgi:excisionase family DNA binding protein
VDLPPYVWPVGEERSPESIVERLRSAAGRLMSADDVAKVLGESRRRVYELRDSHGLGAYRVGRRIRFDPAEVAAWLESVRDPEDFGR